MSEPDNRKQALQNPNQSWIQNYRDYTGQRGTLSERNSFKKDYVSEENVDARMGLGTYDKLREEAIQLLFGTEGYNSGTKSERRRFDRRFNRNLRKGKLLPKSTTEPITQTNTVSTNGKVIYPALWNTYNIKPRGFLFNSQFLNSGIGIVDNPESKLRTDAEWDAIAAEKLGEGKTMQDVKDWQKLLGITVDGKWGDLTQAAYDAYLQRTQNKPLIKLKRDFVSPFNVNDPSYLMKHSAYGNLGYTPTAFATLTTPTTFTSSETPSGTPISSTAKKYDINNSEYFRAPHAFANKDGGSQMITVNGKQYPIVVTKNMLSRDNYAGLENDQTYAYDETTGKFIKVKENMFGIVKGGFDDALFEGDWFDPNSYYQKRQNWLKANPEPSMRGPLGGEITDEWKEWSKNYSEVSPTFYQKQGGKMNKIKYFQQGGTATLQQDVQQQVIQLVQAAMLGDQEATETINQIMQAAQMAPMIKQVIEQMKGQTNMAKQGSKLGYIRNLKYAKGGKTCPTCQNGGKSLQTTVVKKPTKKVEEKACGGKAKKRYFGGYI